MGKEQLVKMISFMAEFTPPLAPFQTQQLFISLGLPPLRTVNGIIRGTAAKSETPSLGWVDQFPPSSASIDGLSHTASIFDLSLEDRLSKRLNGFNSLRPKRLLCCSGGHNRILVFIHFVTEERG